MIKDVLFLYIEVFVNIKIKAINIAMKYIIIFLQIKKNFFFYEKRLIKLTLKL